MFEGRLNKKIIVGLLLWVAALFYIMEIIPWPGWKTLTTLASYLLSGTLGGLVVLGVLFLAMGAVELKESRTRAKLLQTRPTRQ